MLKYDNTIVSLSYATGQSLVIRTDKKLTFVSVFKGETSMQYIMDTNEKEITQKKPRDSRRLTREYIKTAFLYLLKETSYEKVTVTAIINRAGVSRAGFYRNYSSKEEVLNDLSTDIYEQMTGTFLQDLNLDNLYERYTLLFERLKDNADWFEILSSLRPYSNLAFNPSAHLKKPTSSLTTEEYYQCIAIFHSQRGIILSWFENGMKETPSEMAAIFLKLYKHQFSNLQ